MCIAQLPATITLAPPTGRSQLPIVELDRERVNTPGAHLNPPSIAEIINGPSCSLGAFSDTLVFEAWPLFHAVMKTELARSFTQDKAERHGICFADTYGDMFIWNTDNFRLQNGGVFSRKDSTRTYLSGRIAEGIAYLAMQQRGYPFWDHLPSLWERAVNHNNISHSEQLRIAQAVVAKLEVKWPLKEPDFGFEKFDGEVALVESKGGFIDPTAPKQSVKPDFVHGLKQIEAWMDYIAPPPHKAFVFGTYLREQRDNDGDPSLIAFVDPPGNDNNTGAQRIEFPTDWIRRGNYGAWLIGMGFSAGGNALRNGREVSLPAYNLPIVTVGRREYAVTFQGVTVKPNGMRHFSLLMPWIDSLFFLQDLWHHPRGVHILREIGIVGVTVKGVEIGVLNQIQDSVSNSASDALMRLEIGATIREESLTDGFTGSVMLDGTLLGQIEPELLSNIRTERFRL